MTLVQYHCEITMSTTLLPTRHLIELPSHPSAASTARRRVIASLLEWGCPRDGEVHYMLGVIVSELVTNAVTHAGRHTPRILVTVRLDDRAVRIGIRDNHADRLQRRAPSLCATDGRGTAIVEALLDEYGGHLSTEMHDDGKTIWAEVPSRLFACR
ncbi:ATP-binding protein [Streptomyces spinosisporus]|uniref:ATP-binding protein n=1 Tax=Streptomyces spinosisporus TaxID=2927582 RepID=A0ABS9XSG1_9ACTN|nr:ATP-binding protein [Streptomyces spinosisporus]MCI3245018.1 ATP-binding protein [Streptomyces spinosisporus]